MSTRPGTAAVIAVGDELVSGEQADRNSPWLAERLGELGFEVEEVRLVGDDEEEIATALREAAARRALVIATGGLGPTLDDVTRHAAARAAAVELELCREALEEIEAFWSERGRAMPRANERQALIPAGAVLLANEAGTAPGFRLALAGSELAVLPGPPREMRVVFERQLAAWVAGLPGHGQVILRARLHLHGLSESDFADLLGARMERGADPRIGVLARAGVLVVKLEARAAEEAQARARLDERLADLRRLLGRYLFSEETDDLALVVGRRLIETGATLATAESCTGGLVAERLTGVPGISAAFLEGFVTYSNRAKTERLGVPAALLERHGAVSAEVAAAMARGAAERAGARVAVSVTGVAGPAGGTPEKPVGLVCFGLCRDGRVETRERRFPPRGRDLVRAFAANTALDLVRRALG